VQRTEGSTTTKVAFSGGTSIAEYTVGGASSPAVEYIRGSDWGGGVGGILYTIRSGTLGVTHYDGRGDVVAKNDASGVLTYQASYEAFGKRTQEYGSTQDRQKANTKEEDPTGLLNEGFRYRDLETGAFITRDPLGFVDGPNMYTYVNQNPWSHFDPEGLADVPLAKPKDLTEGAFSAKISLDTPVLRATLPLTSNDKEKLTLEPVASSRKVSDEQKAIANTAYNMIGTSTRCKATNDGSLGCALGVSMIFKEATGNNILPDQPKVYGTADLYDGMSRDSRFTKVKLKDAESGDIVITPRGTKAGHTGVVGYNNEIISNSSSGFTGTKTDPKAKGTIQNNYTIDKWQKQVTPRNPSQTAAFRYTNPPDAQK